MPSLFVSAASNSALHISSLQPRWGGPRFLLDNNNAGGAAGGGGTGDGGNGGGANGGGAGDGGAGGGGAGGGGAGGGGAGGGGSNNGGGAGSGGGAGGGQSGGGGGAPSPYRPDGLPDHFAGTSDKDTIDKLFTAVNGFRSKQGEAGAVPEKAEGYVLQASDKLKPYVTNFDKDPVYAKTREIAHKAGMTDKTFNAFLGPLLENLVEGGLVAAPIDPKAVLKGMAPAEMANASDDEKIAAGSKRVTDNIAWADGAKASKALPEDIATFLATSAADNAAANKLIEWLRGSNNETRPALPSGGGSSGMSDDQLKARINDPRNNPSSAQYDKAFAAETDTLSRKHWG
ncbi:hypothetical protein ACVWW6_005530 [Bradyrhizobium sp. USDA 3311]